MSIQKRNADGTPSERPQKLSSALRERLKRISRYQMIQLKPKSNCILQSSLSDLQFAATEINQPLSESSTTSYETINFPAFIKDNKREHTDSIKTTLNADDTSSIFTEYVCSHGSESNRHETFVSPRSIFPLEHKGNTFLSPMLQTPEPVQASENLYLHNNTSNLTPLSGQVFSTPKLADSDSSSPSLLTVNSNLSLEAKDTERSYHCSNDKHNLRSIKQSLFEKEEKLRKLKLVKTYRNKNDLTQLKCLILKWRTAAQEVIMQLYDLVPEPKGSLTQFLSALEVDFKLLNYNPDCESFV